MNGWIDENMNDWMNECVHERIILRLMDEQMKIWIIELLNEWMGAWIDYS